MSWIKEIHEIRPWRKYSQQYEESFIEFILSKIPSVKKHLVEFGAWDGYHLSNTRYFIEKGYSHLLVDGNNHGNQEVKEHFITAENCVEILEKYDTPKSFDLFVIDIDGNDLYVLEEVLKNGYAPQLIVAEFNPIFQPTESKTIRYNPSHTWGNDDYYGFSFAAGVKMAEKHGYTCVFQENSLNMYLVKSDLVPEKPVLTYEIKHDHAKSEKNDWVDY